MTSEKLHLWRVTLPIENPLRVKYKRISDVRLSSHLCENETVLMYLPYDNVEEAYEYCKDLGINTWALSKMDEPHKRKINDK